MMTKNQINEYEQLEMLTIEQLVPKDHFVRKLDAAIDFHFIYPLVEHLYSATIYLWHPFDAPNTMPISVQIISH
ncbi:hypothetical protein [Psychrobacillus sp. FJAT-21963]|uniref:hypothetical protein n=1 Tax=Psychrobacillus sp. FJAT-21963 TaxID=1712028 RepID=UPI0006F5E8AE|nr:hypothetical protein [Psychrobacillus sp. FJAT-21963]